MRIPANAMRFLICGIFITFFPTWAHCEDKAPSQVRAILWYNKPADAFGWFVFKEDYTPIWYCFKTINGGKISSDSLPPEVAFKVHAEVELNPLVIDIRGADFGYSAKFTHMGKRAELASIKTLLIDAADGIFAASVIVKDIKSIPANLDEAKGFGLIQLKEWIKNGKFIIEDADSQTVP